MNTWTRVNRFLARPSRPAPRWLLLAGVLFWLTVALWSALDAACGELVVWNSIVAAFAAVFTVQDARALAKHHVLVEGYAAGQRILREAVADENASYAKRLRFRAMKRWAK